MINEQPTNEEVNETIAKLKSGNCNVEEVE